MAISRRSFLKASLFAGVGAGLAKLPSSSFASGMGNSASKFVFINFADGYPSGTWHPTGDSGGLMMNACTQGLEAYKNDIVFLAGCRSEGGSGHSGYNGVWQEEIGQGSIDVHFETIFAQGMPKRAVRLGVDTNYWGHGGLVTSRSVNGSGLVHNDDPNAVFTELFGVQQDGQDPIEQRKLALLSSYLEDVAELSYNLNGLEQSKLDTYSQASTETKQELENALNSTGQCSNSLYVSDSYGRDKTADLQVANAAMALSCDKTRIVSLQFGTSNDSKIVEIVSNTAPHSASHYGSSSMKQTYIAHRQWYMSKVTKLIDHLKLLGIYDDCIIYVTSEMDDGQAHTSDDLPCMLIGGRNTKLKTQEGGRIIRDVGAIGQVLSSFASAYDVPNPYRNSAIDSLFI
ncbi:DUF1552 domain-containing protein [Vibrio coralliilyticus]|uniref:DUF1552 domain-containing protein n=1 Tax=Vibrio coralliilyticus TaxID=190893 RepID=UPI0015600193|nr:DUF1552 domain-containing protein [Vibrio coralliilyticus]NRF27997.1 DUF1552 domain-containing protein [Vibrio coralliilyticus]NRF82112.1 DUF1552 domain-containing protein [Vibrio coralliilyticus]